MLILDPQILHNDQFELNKIRTNSTALEYLIPSDSKNTG